MNGVDAAATRDVVVGIDTATPHLAVALVDLHGTLLAATAPSVDRDHAARIVPELEALFATADTAPARIHGIAVGIGPGSYTGLRIGIATAKGLAYGWDVPVAGSDTLGAIADAGLAPGETGIAAIDARRGNVYYGVYHRGAGGATALALPAKAAREDVAARHPGLRIVAGIAPAAAWHARGFDPTRPPRAIYL